MTTLRSFDGTEEIEAHIVRPDRFRQLLANLARPNTIARGAGLNYCLAAGTAGGQTVLSTTFNRFIAFEADRPAVRVESGVTMGQLFEFATARNLLPPVLPGHPRITVGGAVAMNIHGKNRHRFGNFADHVLRLTLYHPRHGELHCSRSENPELFWLTVGGFGLTGFLLSVEIALIALPGKSLTAKRHEVRDMVEAAALLEQLADSADYLYSWHDLNRKGSKFGRGIVYSERFSPGPRRTVTPSASTAVFKPFPFALLNNVTLPPMCRIYNFIENVSAREKAADLFSGSFPIVGKETYFRLFGKRGFREYQLLAPLENWARFTEKLAAAIDTFRVPAALASLKLFNGGQQRFLNFTGSGISLALDIPNIPAAAAFFSKLDQITTEAGGIANISKDSRLSADAVRGMYRGYDAFRSALNAYDPEAHFKSELRRRLDL
jgi:decaprenylphospho-beta-D-ribofuranose 2-oxidase